MLKIEFCEDGTGRGKEKSSSIQATLHESLLLPHDIEWVVWGNLLKQLLLQFLVMTPLCVAIMWWRRIVHLDSVRARGSSFFDLYGCGGSQRILAVQVKM